MKIALLAGALVSLTLAFNSPSFAADELPLPTAPTLSAVAEELVDALVKGDFAEANTHFNATMKRAMPEPRLREMWNSLIQQVGPFRQRLGTRVEKQANAEVIYVMCEFKEFTLEAKVVFNAAGEVAGLRFAPPPRSVPGDT